MLQVTIPFEEKPTSNLPGDNLRYYRQRKSLTTRQLAEQIDVVPATILMYEQNKHPIPFDVANSLADALDVNADLLYDDFAVFLVTPYSEALKDIRMSIGMSHPQQAGNKLDRGLVVGAKLRLADGHQHHNAEHRAGRTEQQHKQIYPAQIPAYKRIHRRPPSPADTL